MWIREKHTRVNLTEIFLHVELRTKLFTCEIDYLQNCFKQNDKT